MTDNQSLMSFASGELSLEGTLTVPPTTPGPAALLISGSGPIDRNSNAKHLAINVMGELAAHLAASGITSLRYDKRGIGRSQGDYFRAGFHDNIVDAQAALAALRARPEVDTSRAFVVGHSEGAIIASALADDDHLAGAVLLAGTAQNGHDLLMWQAGQIEATQPPPIRWLMRLLRRDLVRAQSRRLDQIRETDAKTRSPDLNITWLREFMAYEPSDALRRAKAPILAVTGSKDLQVDPADVGLIEQLVPSPVTGHVVDDLSHLLRAEAGPASLRTYHQQTRRPIDEGLAQLVTEWMASIITDQGALKP